MKILCKSYALCFLYFLSVFSCVSAARAQIISTFAGNGVAGFSGDGGPATAASFNQIAHAAFDASANLYVTDYNNNRIRKIATDGTVTTIGGTGVAGSTGDGGPATAARFNHPNGLAFDASGNLYIADQYNNVVRKISPSGTVSRFAGNGSYGYSGDGGPATAAKLRNATNVTVDALGNVFITDYGSHRIRKVDGSGIITTVVGTGAPGFSGDGGPATSAMIYQPVQVAFDAAGNMYFGDQLNNRIRKVTTSGIISTVVGTGPTGYSGDGGPATNATLYYPGGLNFDASGNLFIADSYNNVVRKVNTSGTISTFAGTGAAGYGGDGGPAIAALLYECTDVTFDASGNIYVCDFFNSRVRKIVISNFPPRFDSGLSAHITVCQNSPAIAINTLLATTDSSAGETETWSVVLTPVHGVLAGLSTTITSTGSSVSPAGVTYMPNTGYWGSDSCRVRVSDGTTSDTLTVYINVTPLPVAGVVSGPATVCPGATISLSSTSAGGVWSSSNAAVATVGSTGTVGGASAGTAIISYTVTNSCGTTTDTQLVTVQALPVAGTVNGPTAVCAGATIVLSTTGTGGVWSSSNTTIATVGPTGTTGGASGGTAIISYTVSNSCGSVSDTQQVTVLTIPVAGTIGGPSVICPGTTVSLSTTGTGGTWSSSNPSVATVGAATGIAGGVTTGTSVISYTVSNSCGSATDTQLVTVNTTPSAGVITGPDTVCAGSTITLADGVPGGIWSSSNTTVATVSTTGTAGGASAGTAVISYTISNACGTAFTTHTVTVRPLPVAGTITGGHSLCEGSAMTLADGTPGGTWSSSNTSVATVGATGTVYATTAGTTIIAYSVTNSCGTVADTQAVTVYGLPAVTISGSSNLCAGVTATLTATPAGGNWNAGASPVATIDASGTIHALSSGSITITYTTAADANGCIGQGTIAVTVTTTAPFTVSETITRIKCNGDANGSISLTVSPAGAYSYSWSTGSTTATIPDLAAGSYTVIVSDEASGCRDTASYTLQNPGMISLSDTVIHPDACGRNQGSINLVNIAGGTSPYSYSWSTGGSASSISGEPAGDYTLTITDANMCRSTFTFTIPEDSCLDINIHNVITPNGDGINDVWVIEGISSYPGNRVQVFDKWGDMVYSQDHYDNTWNGATLPDGTYFYVVELVSGTNDKGKSLKGSLLIKR